MRPYVFRALAGVLLILVLASAGLLALRIPRLRIRVQDFEFLPRTSDVLAADAEIRRTFGSDDRLIVGLESRRREVTDPAFLADFRFLVEEVARDPNLRMLLLDRLTRPRLQPEAVAGEPFLLHAPDPSWIAAALRSTALTRKLAVGKSRRVGFFELAALSPTGVRSTEESVRAAFARLAARRPGEYTLHVVGRHVVLNGLGQTIFEDLRRLLPWSFAIVFVILLLTFRSLLPAVVAIGEVGMSVACTMGILQWLGHDLSLMTAVVPVLVTVLGIADEIHLFGELYHLKALHPHWSRPALAWGAARNVFFAVTATTFTTAIGFFAFLVPDVPALRIFGAAAGMGVCMSWLFTLLFVPALLSLIPAGPGPRWARGHQGGAALSSPFRNAVPIALTLLLLPGIFRLRIDDGWTRNFSPEHPIVQHDRWFRGESTGLYQFDLLLERLDARPWTEPDVLRSLDGLQARIDVLPVVTASVSLADLVRDRAWELGPLDAPRPAVPGSHAEVERLLRTYRVFNEQVFVTSVLDRERARTRLMVFTSGDDYETSTRAGESLERLVREVFGDSVRLTVGGSAERGRVLIGAVVSSQGQSVVSSLVISWLALWLASGDWRRALRCVAANAWALALVLGLAGWAGLSLGVASSCFLALGIGVGLDYAIHLAFQPADSDGQSMLRTVQLRVLANVGAVGAGLGVLAFSSNPAIAKLGLLIVLSMAASGYAALVFFPAATRRRRVVAPEPEPVAS
ncbi:MAG TPA: MMPL family transporter [Thermoanaerobaculia bacterium]|nr:MMPL family transporter [Thermoanaerobaculia bacterium]